MKDSPVWLGVRTADWSRCALGKRLVLPKQVPRGEMDTLYGCKKVFVELSQVAGPYQWSNSHVNTTWITRSAVVSPLEKLRCCDAYIAICGKQ